MTDLQLSIKVSPDAYTFDPKSWVPVTRPRMPPKQVAKKAAERDPTDTPLVPVDEKSQ